MNVLTRILDRLHADTDAAAAAAGWTLTRTGWGRRSYRWTAPLAVPATTTQRTTATATGCAVVIDLAAHRARTTTTHQSAAAAAVVTGAPSGGAA